MLPVVAAHTKAFWHQMSVTHRMFLSLLEASLLGGLKGQRLTG